MLFADQVKNDLLNLIQEMSAQVNFSKEPGKHFSRKRKLDFSTMMHFILSMEAGSLKKELHKYFSYNPSSASASAFIQQRSKLSDNAFPHLFRSFNSHYTYSLYKREYQLLAVDGSTFTYTRNERDQDSFFPPNVTIKFMLFPLLTCFLKGTLTVLYSLSARKMSSTLLPISLTDTFLTLALNLFLLLTVVFILSMFSLTQ